MIREEDFCGNKTEELRRSTENCLAEKKREREERERGEIEGWGTRRKGGDANRELSKCLVAAIWGSEISDCVTRVSVHLSVISDALLRHTRVCNLIMYNRTWKSHYYKIGVEGSVV